MPSPNQPGTPLLHVLLFGEPRLLTIHGRAVRVNSQRTAALLAYLSHFSGRQNSRERLVDLFWPDSDESAGRARLRNVLSDLRHVIESAGANPDIILTATRTSIGINAASVQTDVAQFECLLKQANGQSTETVIPLLQQAVEISAAEFSSTLYDDWVIVERTRLLHLRHEALKRLASVLVDFGRNVDAEETAQILLRDDPACEKTHNIIIGSRIATGDYPGARRQYAALEKALQEELGEVTSDASRDLIAKIPLPSERAPQLLPQPATLAEPRIDRLSPYFSSDALELTEFTSNHRRVWPRRLGLAALAVIVLTVWVGAARFRQNHSPAAVGQQPANPAGTNSHKPVWVYRYAPQADEKDSEPTAMAGTPDGGMVVTGFIRTTHNDVDYLTFKLSADGKLVWRKRYNGTGNDVDRARAVFVDGPGNIYVTGDSDNGKGNGLSRLSGLDIVTVMYDKDGNEMWVQRLNGTADGDDRPIQLAYGGDTSSGIAVLGTVEAKVPGGLPRITKTIAVNYTTEGKEKWRHVVDEDTAEAGRAVSMYPANGGGTIVCGQVIATTRAGREMDISTTFLSPDGKVIWAKRYGIGNGADDEPLRIAVEKGNQSWVLGIGRLPESPPASPRELMAVTYGSEGEFLGARPLGVQSDRIERIWSTTGSRLRQSILATTTDKVGSHLYWLVTVNADGSRAWETTVGPSEFENGTQITGCAESRVMCNSTGKSTWVAIPVSGGVDKHGWQPADIKTIRYDADGRIVWQDTFGNLEDADEPRAMGFGGNSNVYIAGMRSNYFSKVPGTTIVVKYAE